MPTLLNFLVRLFLLVAGLVFAASLAVAAILGLALWGVRAAWYKLTGRPVMPFVVRIDPRGGFDRVRRPAGARPVRNPGDVTDVEARPLD